MNDFGEIYNLNEMAIYLKISISELRKLVREQQIPCFRIGSRIKFNIKEVSSWIEKQKNIEIKKSYIFLNQDYML